LQELGRMEEATAVLGQLVVDHSKLAAAWVSLAHAVAAQGFEWEAHNAIRKALKAKPDAETLVAASAMLLTLQDNRAAESACRQAVKMAPDSATAWIHLGHALAAQVRKADAAEAYKQALAIDPQNDVAAFFLAALGDGRESGATVTPRAYVRALFDSYAERFDKALQGTLRYRTPEMLERLFSEWTTQTKRAPAKPMAIIDAGCGTGLCGPWLAKCRGNGGRLIGIDLSRGMIQQARARGMYDELIVGEIVEELERRQEPADLIVAADVWVYFGDLTLAFAAIAQALRPGGVLMFSVESTESEDFILLPTQRFAHSMNYLHRLASVNEMAVRVTEDVVLRQEKGRDVQGYLVLMEKTLSPHD